MERADGTLQEKRFEGDALNCVAWALASTLAALNRAGFIHGDCNVLWKKMRIHNASSFQSFKPGEAVSQSDLIRTSAFTPAYAAPEVNTHSGRQQNVKSDIYAWALTLKRVASAPVAEPLKTLLEECLAEDPSKRPSDFTAISGRLESASYVAWGQQLADL
eukprot:4534283-Amphidinium_carterae.1